MAEEDGGSDVGERAKNNNRGVTEGIEQEEEEEEEEEGWQRGAIEEEK